MPGSGHNRLLDNACQGDGVYFEVNNFLSLSKIGYLNDHIFLHILHHHTFLARIDFFHSL